MDERAWVGPAEHAPEGWTVFPSLEAFLDSPVRADRVVLDDRAAVLREADFLKVYAHAPLAQIVRRVGPWRAGVGRTDPAWPLVTTMGMESASRIESDLSAQLRPFTAGYDELAPSDVGVDLAGMAVAMRISDPELRGMWIDCLASAGAELAPVMEAEVLIVDGLAHRDLPRTHEQAPRLVVTLCPDPWNAEPSSHEEIVASVLDSPWSVMQDICHRLKRGDREID